MRRIAHLSDIHFGRVDYDVVEKAVAKINEVEPHLVVVSGDLTQRAKSNEFIEARAFLDRLPQPQIVVPGNHDVPLYNVFDRFARPLAKFRRFITGDLSPTYMDEELAVIGLNTARSLVVKGGRVNEEQIELVRSKMCVVPDRVLKIVVTHHPFDLPEGFDDDDIVGRAQKAMPRISDCGADVFLAGHLHVSHIITTARRYPLENGKAALVVQAGTTTSVRARGEAHSFNVLEFDEPMLSVSRYECLLVHDGFKPVETRRYVQSDRGWEPAGEV